MQNFIQSIVLIYTFVVRYLPTAIKFARLAQDMFQSVAGSGKREYVINQLKQEFNSPLPFLSEAAWDELMALAVERAVDIIKDRTGKGSE